jgi:predicted ATPase
VNQQQITTEEPTQAAVREQLERMLARAPFNRSPVLSRFLTHVVEHALGGDGPPLKEYTLGLEVFDRSDDFDPRVDTIVRVQARRLRGAMDSYYEGAGKHDTVRLEMPKGQYGIRASQLTPAQNGFGHRAETSAPGGGTFATAPIPVARTPLIGRDRELRQLAAMLGEERTRLLTVTGVGGSGKTRLALAAAEAIGHAFPGGVLFLDLSSVRECSVLIELLAEAFRVRRTDGRPLLQVMAERLRENENRPVLLVLDNMEGVLDGADVLGELLDASGLLTILVTSRIALHLYGECEFPLAPLAVPDAGQRIDAARLAEVPSVKLFLARSAAANPRMDFSKDMDALAELCVRLDGLPLAIELVAAQAGALSPRQMLERFTGHLDLPENPARDAPSRQRTLRRVIDSSFDLLDDATRIALRRLSVFAGGFTLEAAEAVADAGEDLGARLLPALNTLVSMGMLNFQPMQDEPRYAMLETLRAYGRERLNASGEAESVRKAHAAYFLVLAEETLESLTAAQREAWLARCDSEQDNFRQALDYLPRAGPPLWALRLGHALFSYWEPREHLVEGARLMKGIVDRVPADVDPALWAKVSTYAGALAAFGGEQAVAYARYQDVLALYRRLGDRKGEAMMLNGLGVISRFDDNALQARDWYGRALEVCREIDDRGQIAATLSNLAECELKLGDIDSARRLLVEAHELFVSEQERLPAAWCLNHLGDVAHDSGDLDTAADYYSRAEIEFVRLDDAWGLARSRADRGSLALARGDHRQAGALLLDALRAFDKVSHRRGMAKVADSLAALAHAFDHDELAVKLLATAEGWRSAVGFVARMDDLEFTRPLREDVGFGLDEAGLEALREAGRHMSADDVAAAITGLIEAGDA